MLITASKDASRFPLRCCVPIKVSTLPFRHLISTNVLNAYRMKGVELADRNPTYCVKPGCGRYVPANMKDKFSTSAACLYCKTKTCTICKKRMHPGLCIPDGIQDEASRALIVLANDLEWKKCPKCKSLIEKTCGCNMECM